MPAMRRIGSVWRAGKGDRNDTQRRESEPSKAVGGGELAKNKAAREFLNLHGNEIAVYITDLVPEYMNYRNRLASKLRALIQPEEKK